MLFYYPYNHYWLKLKKEHYEKYFTLLSIIDRSCCL